MQVQVVQFIRPNGRQSLQETTLPDYVKGKYEAILRCGLRFTSEVLMNNTVSTCIEEPELGDFDISVTKNGPEVQIGMVKMLQAFDENKFHSWKGTYL